MSVLLVGLFLTPDQQGQRLMERGDFAEAADVFEDPMRVGAAWYRAGEFKKAEAAFRQIASPDADYNRGNCFIFLGQYEEAIQSFDRALQVKPDWDAARTNREIARIRAKATEHTGGDQGDQKIGADKMVFDKPKNNKGQETTIQKDQETSHQDMQALWLRRVQTDPADFLKNKFSYQHTMETEP
ncbi:tetratricopeptide repeat protein [Pontiellaceae bacterium B12227]|nr:tetratricopeptide repeat protein [Pontiellaceae bacterium B12227]